jgi:DNA-binding response OmpR family regulator
MHASKHAAIRLRHLHGAGWVLTIHASARAADDWAAVQRRWLLPHDAPIHRDFTPSWRPPRAVILEARKPGRELDDLVESLRETGLAGTLPTVLATRANVALGIDSAIDDVVVIPCPPDEIAERIHRIEQRRAEAVAPEPVEVGALRVDLASQRLWVHGRRIALTGLEYGLLSFLVQHRGQTYSRAELLQIRNQQGGRRSRNIAFTMRKLRSKLGPAGATLETVRGAGYRFVAPRSRPTAARYA